MVVNVSLRQGDYGWLAVLAVVVGVELLSEELLSEAADRYLENHPILTRAIIALTAMHIANLIDDDVDPFHIGFMWLRRVRRHHNQTPTAMNATATTGISLRPIASYRRTPDESLRG